MCMRPLCKACERRPRAIAYYRNDKCVYRSRCTECERRHKKLPAQTPRWTAQGYKLKKACDLCGFRAKIARQLLVYHLDGNLNNCQLHNLRTVCHNCAVELSWDKSVWRRGDDVE
jgi:hypothetical protein